jgi:PadR family transcriptional regulator, regulatory protein PadR
MQELESTRLQAKRKPYLEIVVTLSDQRQNPENDPPSTEGGTYSDIQARPKNWLVPVALVILRECSSYGYQLMERMVDLGYETVNPGTLYRTLRKMEKDGFCESKWETASAGPARRMYSITAVGEAYLDLWVKSLEHFQRSMDAFFQAYSRGGGSGSEETGSETP